MTASGRYYVVVECQLFDAASREKVDAPFRRTFTVDAATRARALSLAAVKARDGFNKHGNPTFITAAGVSAFKAA